MYYPDFTPYCYIEREAPNVLNIGWLETPHPFPRKKASEVLLDALFEKCLHLVHQTRGHHQCQFCDVPTRGVEVSRNGKSMWLGSAEIRVQAQDGRIYAAPNLIYHYVIEHDYDPPQKFVEALLGHEHELREPRNDEEWRALHAIRRKVLFENRGKVDSYIENHPDDFKTDHHPLILLYKNVVIGVIRVEVREAVAWFRRVAIQENLQRLGHGRVLLRLAEAFAKSKGCTEVRSNAAVEAVGFYERCGYSSDLSAPAPANAVSVWKSLGEHQ